MLPGVAKVFTPDIIAPGDTTQLMITLNNPNALVATLSADLTDSLPNGVTVAAIPNVGGSCTGTVTAVAGAGTVTYNTSGTIPANSSCTITVDVVSSTPGAVTNTIVANALQTDVGSNAAPASDDLTVTTLPSVTKAFAPASISPGDTSVLTITLTNPNTGIATLSADLTDTLPAGVTVTNPAVIGGSCLGTVTAAADSNTVTYDSGGTIPAGSDCTITAEVTSSTPGAATNTIAVGALQTDLGDNAVAATDVLDVGAAQTTLSVTKVASADPISTGVAFDYTITVTSNADGSPANNVTVSDTLDPILTINSVTASGGGSATPPPYTAGKRLPVPGRVFPTQAVKPVRLT